MSLSQAFPVSERVHQAKHFQSFREEGKRHHSRTFVCVTLPNQLSHARMGCIVTKKTGSTVVRNGWKRFFRSFYRQNKELFRSNMDYLFIVKSSFKDSPTHSHTREVIQLLEKCSV